MTYFKNIKAIFLFLMFAAVIVSCNKENTDIDDMTEGEIELQNEKEQNPLLTRSTSSETGLDLDCFTVLYTFSVVDSIGDTYEIANSEDLDNLASNGTVIIDFVYPVTIEFEDGETQEISEGQALGEAFANCFPNEWSSEEFPAFLINDCYSFVYPVAVVNVDGDVTSTNSEEEFITAISEEVQFFSFPLTLTGDDGEVVVVQNGDELPLVLVGCNGIVDSTWTLSSSYACYELQFPLDLVINDGTTETVGTLAVYYDFLFQGNVLGFGYPLTLLDTNGEAIVINSSEELTEAVVACDNVLTFDLLTLFVGATTPDPATGLTCYDINFPIDVNELASDGSVANTVTLNNIADFTALPGIEQGWIFSLPVYPYSVTSVASGEVTEITSYQDFITFSESCN